MTKKKRIDNPDAYERGKQARIAENARKTRHREWIAKGDHRELHDWLMGTGDFAPEYTFNTDGWIVSEKAHPLTYGMYGGDFGGVLYSIRESLMEWGALTEKQTALVRKALAKRREWQKEREQREAQRQERDSKSKHIGTVGKREEFTLTLEKTIEYETDYGLMFINLCRDEDDNIVVYKGSNAWDAVVDEGESFTVRATVKEHGVREGVNQTIVNRPKIKEQ